MDNFQEINDSAQPIDVSLGMTSGGVSDSVKLADEVLNSGYQSPLNETLSESIKAMSELSASSFSKVLDNTPELNFPTPGRIGTGNSSDQPLIPGQNQLFKLDNSENWNQEINLDDYYTRMSDGWSRLDKDSGGAMAIGGLATTGALTGAAIGSMIAPGVGTAVGGIIGGVLGAYEGSQVADTVGSGYVRNKYGINEDARSKTGFFGGLGTASLKMIHSANAVNLNLAGMLAYAPEAISQGSLNVMFNNKYTKLLDDYDKSSESSNRVYHSKDYDNASLLGSFGYSEMWIEKVAPAIGFTLGALAGGKGTGTILKGVGLTGTGTASASRAFLSSIPKQMALSESRALGVKTLTAGFKEAVKADLKAQTFKSLAGNTISTMVSAAPEAGIEARSAMNESREDYIHYFQIGNGRYPTSEELAKFEQDNIRTGNGVFGANMAILSASNWLQFGDLIGVDKGVREGFFDNAIKNAFGLGIKRGVGEITEKGVEKAVWQMADRTFKQKVGYGLFKALEDPFVEGSQEGMQSIISGTQKDYLESRYNPKATQANKSIMSSVGDSFTKTMSSREGWEEILIGGLVGGISSVRTKGGIDFMNIRESRNAGNEVQEKVNLLNQTSSDFADSHGDYLEKQALYNRLNNNYVSRFNDRLGSSNQQMVNSDKSKQYLASGELELARIAYQNSLFAKLSAERKAGISDSSKFDVDMLIESTPDETLKEMYGFQTEEQIQEFKDETSKRLNDIHESFNAAYDMAETLNLGSGTKSFSPSQVTEMAALHLFHGMQSADNANSIARNLEKVVGIGGVADAMNHYINLTGQNKERINRLRELEDETLELNKKHSELLEAFSREANKPTRAPENETTINYLDRINKQLEAISNDISRLEDEKNSIGQILDSQQGMPTLPFGNSASKFFDSTNLKFGDKSTRQVLESLTAFDKYVSHLQDVTGKSDEEIEADKAKAETISSMVDNYKSQMGLMRNFAKVSQMVTDPAYVNNIAKSIFNSKKYDEIFDNEDWINNNEAGLDEQSIAEFKELQQRLKDGNISKYDIHTYITNAEILRLGEKTLEPESEKDPISNFDINSVIIDGDNGERIFDVDSDTGKMLIDITAQAVIDNNISPNQQIVYNLANAQVIKRIQDIKTNRPSSISDVIQEGKTDKAKEIERLTRIAEEKKEQLEADFSEQYPISKIISGEISLPGGVTLQQSGDTTIETEIVDATTLKVGDKVFYMDKVRTIKTIGQNLFGVSTMTFEDGMNVTNEVTDGWMINKVIKEASTTQNEDSIIIDKETDFAKLPAKKLAELKQKVLDKIDSFPDDHFFLIHLTPSKEALNGIMANGLNTGGPAVESTTNVASSKEALKNSLMAIMDGKVSHRGSANLAILAFSNDIIQNKGPKVQFSEEVNDYIALNYTADFGTRIPAEFSFASFKDGEITIKGENTASNTATESEMSLEDVIASLENELNRQKSKIDAQLQEAINPTTQENLDIKNSLDELNTTINEIVKEVESQNKEINRDEVDTFIQSSIPIKKEFAEISKLLNQGVRTEREEDRLRELLKKVNSYGLVEGRVQEYKDQPIRLSDLLEQRAQLENELFSQNKTVTPLSPEQMKMTFDSTTEDESTLAIKDGQKVGDAAVLNNYDFSTFVKIGDNYQIANLTPQGFVEEITRDKNSAVTVLDSDNNPRDINTNQESWDREVQPGDTVIVDISNTDTISFKVDNARRIILPISNAETLSEITNLSFSSKNKIGKTNFHVLTRVDEGVETYLGSDFGVELDNDATQRLNPGDGIYFEYDNENIYNQGLKEEYDKVHPNENSPEMKIANRVEDLISQITENKTLIKNNTGDTEALKKENKALFSEIRLLLPEVKTDTISSTKKASREMLKAYNKQFDKKLQDAAKRKMKDNMVLVAKDSSGNKVGVVKSLQNSSVRGRGRAQMDNLRSSVLEQLISNNFKPKTRTKFTAPVQIVYMGIPNVRSENGEKVVYNFSEQKGDFNINPSKIKSVGYVTYGKMEFNDKRKVSTPYNYAKSILKDETYQGRRVPVVVFNHAGKEIIYPITLIEKNTESLGEQFNKMLENKDSMMIGEFILQANEFLAENGVPKKNRLTSLNFDAEIGNITELVNSMPNIATIDELMDSSNVNSILMENALIDINLNDKPFVGPKIRFDLNAVPQSDSKYLDKESITENITPQTMDEIVNEIDNENCLD